MNDAPPSARTGTDGDGGGAPSARTILERITLLALGIRVVLEAVGIASLSHSGIALGKALRMWVRWDAGHYLRIAEVGYRRGTPPPDDPLFIVFFPFYPSAVRVVSFVVRDLVLSGLVVSFAASIGGAYVFYRLVLLDADHDEAWRAVLLLFSFPTAYFLAAPYTESLFLLATVASVYAARTHRWVRSSLAGALATGTRVSGIALLPALTIEALVSTPVWTSRLRRLVWVALTCAGLGVYLGINWVVHDDPLWFLNVQRFHWDQAPAAPWQTIVTAVTRLVDGDSDPTRTFIYLTRLGAFAFAGALLIAGTRRLRVADTIYGWAGLVLVLSTTWLISLPRYLLVLYPLFMVEAKLVRSRRLLWPVVVAGFLCQVVLFSRYVRGSWAF